MIAVSLPPGVYSTERPTRWTEIGHKFGYWEVISFTKLQGRTAAMCRCVCGLEKIQRKSDLTFRKTKSCGCRMVEFLKENTTGITNIKHGWKHSKTYRVWSRMKERCLRKNHKSYSDYGGRGITVSDSWMKFENFLADMGSVPSGLSIERVNVNGNYEQGNCIWATQSEQARNRRSTCFLTAFGETKCVADWAEDHRCVASYDALSHRAKEGWPAEIAITKKMRGAGRRVMGEVTA